MSPEVLLAGSIGALFVFVLGVLRDYLRRRREREGLMTLIWTEILHNYVVLNRWKGTSTIDFLNAGEVKSFRTEIWAESRVRLAQTLPPHEFLVATVYYSTLEGTRDDANTGLLLTEVDKTGFDVRRADLEEAQNRLWPIASRYAKARHSKLRRLVGL